VYSFFQGSFNTLLSINTHTQKKQNKTKKTWNLNGNDSITHPSKERRQIAVDKTLSLILGIINELHVTAVK